LERELGDAVGDVLDDRAGKSVGGHVRDVLLAIGGIDHHEVLLITKLVDDEVINAAPTLVAEDSVAHAPRPERRVVVRDEVVDACKGRGAGEHDLAHVRDVEEPRLRAHGLVLRENAGGILHGQQVVREWDDLATFGYVHLVQRGFLLHT